MKAFLHLPCAASKAVIKGGLPRGTYRVTFLENSPGLRSHLPWHLQAPFGTSGVSPRSGFILASRWGVARLKPEVTQARYVHVQNEQEQLHGQQGCLEYCRRPRFLNDRFPYLAQNRWEGCSEGRESIFSL